MIRENEIKVQLKVQLKTGLSFCWLHKLIANKLKDLIDVPSSEFIQDAALNQFDIWLEDKESIEQFDALLLEQGYKNRSDWLRDIIRKLDKY